MDDDKNKTQLPVANLPPPPKDVTELPENYHRLSPRAKLAFHRMQQAINARNTAQGK